MKKNLLSAVLILLPFLSLAQRSDSLATPKKWGIGVSAGFGTTWRNETLFEANGLVLAVEPSYKVSSTVTLGVRAEYVFIKTFYDGEVGQTEEVQAKTFPSFSVTGDFKPWKGKISPFIGLGAGLYFLGSVTRVGNSPADNNLQTRFGLSPRIGLQMGKVAVLGELNVIDEESIYNRDYVSVKLRYNF
jgi:hypothetical protein